MQLPLSCDTSNLPLSALQGGYNFLDIVQDRLTPHPGVDLNTPGGPQTDCNLPVYAAVHGYIRALIPWPSSHPTGEGNHIWVEIDDAQPAPFPPSVGIQPMDLFPYVSSWAHYDHLNAFAPSIQVGQEVQPDTLIGYCGRTGNWPACHLHFEILKHAPPTPNYWPKGASKAFVSMHYHNPFTYLANYTPKPDTPATPPAPETDNGTPDADPPTLQDYANALRLANLQKHEMEAYIVDPAHKQSVDAAATQENNPPIVLMLRWAQDHYTAGDVAP